MHAAFVTDEVWGFMLEPAGLDYIKKKAAAEIGTYCIYILYAAGAASILMYCMYLLIVDARTYQILKEKCYQLL